MISRRQAIIAGAITAPGILWSSGAMACREAAPKDQQAYRAVVGKLIEAWKRRDFTAFNATFNADGVSKPFNAKPIFEARALKNTCFVGEILFNGNSAVIQIIEPLPGNPNYGTCDGMATSHLIMASFYPGLDKAVLQSVAYLQSDLLAEPEWKHLRG